jgi:3-oxoacyl-[acyl-carrier-protein] synthase II
VTPSAPRAVALDDAIAALPAGMRARAGRAERVTQLALVAAARALADAALAPSDGEPTPEVGIVLGTAFGCFLTNAAFQARLAAEGMPGASPRLFAATVSNAAAGELAIASRLGGPLLTVSAGAASGLVALGEAASLIRSARASAVVAGGMDAIGAALERWLGEQAWPAAREAAAMMVCEDGDRARARGVRAHGTILGWGGGFEPCPRDPSAGEGLRAAVGCALELAGVVPAEVALVVSGATPALAHLEARGLAGVAAPRLASTRYLGETLAASGPLGVLLALAEARRDALALIVDVCESGHVAALVVRRMGA